MIFGEPRVPFERPIQATSGFVPRSLDTGFVAPENVPLPQVMAARLTRLPGGVHHPLTAEPGVLPPAAPTDQPPSPAKIRAKSARMLPIPLLMTIGMFSPPKVGGIRAGLNPTAMVAAGQKPGV
jgi:hypothetical protein